MKKTVLFATMVALIGMVSACATMGSGGNQIWTPLPEPGTVSAINVVAPQNVSPEIASLSGVWEGGYTAGRQISIVVEQITMEKVIGIYSWGQHPLDNASDKGWVRVLGNVIDGSSILFKWSGRTVKLKLTGPKTAYAEYERNGAILRADLWKK